MIKKNTEAFVKKMNKNKNSFSFWRVLILTLNYLHCIYTFFSTIVFTNTLFTYYVYFADHDWCYYSMIMNIICLLSAIALNFMYTFYFINWIQNNFNIEFDPNYIFFATGNRSPLNTMRQDGRGKWHKAFLFVLYSILKIIDIVSYTNSSLVMFIMSKPIGIYTRDADKYLSALSENKTIIVQTMRKKMYITGLISLVIMDLPQSIISLNALAKKTEAEINFKFATTFTVVRTIISIIWSLGFFIYGYFFENKKAMRDSKVENLIPN